jgi:hypothetical protein
MQRWQPAAGRSHHRPPASGAASQVHGHDHLPDTTRPASIGQQPPAPRCLPRPAPFTCPPPPPPPPHVQRRPLLPQARPRAPSRCHLIRPERHRIWWLLPLPPHRSPSLVRVLRGPRRGGCARPQLPERRGGRPATTFSTGCEGSRQPARAAARWRSRHLGVMALGFGIPPVTHAGWGGGRRASEHFFFLPVLYLNCVLQHSCHEVCS